jgi:hypothetical protein
LFTPSLCINSPAQSDPLQKRFSGLISASLGGIFPNAAQKTACESDFSKCSAKNRPRVGFFKMQCEKSPASRIFQNAVRKIARESDFSKRSAKNRLRVGFFKMQCEKSPASRISPNALRKTAPPDVGG